MSPSLVFNIASCLVTKDMSLSLPLHLFVYALSMKASSISFLLAYIYHTIPHLLRGLCHGGTRNAQSNFYP